MGPSPQLPRLMLVTDRRRLEGRDLAGWVRAAAGGGVGIVQLREKDLAEDELARLARRLRVELPEEVLLVVNGSESAARAVGAGLHLPASAPLRGQGAARIAPYGRSAHDVEEAERAAADGADYVLVGTIYATRSKPAAIVAGPRLVEEVCRAVAPLPVLAIGGVRASRVPELLRAGAHGVAACGAFLRGRDPRRAAATFSLALRVAGEASRSGTSQS